MLRKRVKEFLDNSARETSSNQTILRNKADRSSKTTFKRMDKRGQT